MDDDAEALRRDLKLMALHAPPHVLARLALALCSAMHGPTPATVRVLPPPVRVG